MSYKGIFHQIKVSLNPFFSEQTIDIQIRDLHTSLLIPDISSRFSLLFLKMSITPARLQYTIFVIIHPSLLWWLLLSGLALLPL